MTQVVDSSAALNQSIVAFSRIGSQKSEDLNLNSLVNTVGRIIGQGYENITVTYDLKNTERQTTGERISIESALMNLAINSAYAMPSGGTLSFTVSEVILKEHFCIRHAVNPGEYIAVTISDTGAGISEEIREEIFKPFYTTKEEGTGLGLATVYATMRQHKGCVVLNSEEGVGSTFELYFPMK